MSKRFLGDVSSEVGVAEVVAAAWLVTKIKLKGEP